MNFFTFFQDYIQPKLIDNKFTYLDYEYKFYYDGIGTRLIDKYADISDLVSFYSRSNQQHDQSLVGTDGVYNKDQYVSKWDVATNPNHIGLYKIHLLILRNDKIDEFLDN